MPETAKTLVKKLLESKVFRATAFLVLLVALWEALFRASLWPPFLFPSPFSVFDALASGIADYSVIAAIAGSLKRMFIGYAFALLVGLIIGLMLSRFQILDDTVGVLMLGLQTLPSIVWLPLAILWFGLSETAILFVVVMGALFSITIATRIGVKNVPKNFLNAGRMLGATGPSLYFRVIIPAALPSIISGMKQGWAFAWRSLLAGELIFVTVGLGYLLNMGRELNDVSQVMAVMLVIIAIGLVMDKVVFARIEKTHYFNQA
ncbi:MAG: ABC transporter permease [Candidatus Norongarragalinales archaeon]